MSYPLNYEQFKTLSTDLAKIITDEALHKAVYSRLDDGEGKATALSATKTTFKTGSSALIDKRVVAQWLSKALSGKDYNVYISELKHQASVPGIGSNQVKLSVDKEAALFGVMIDLLEARSQQNTLQSEADFLAGAAGVIAATFPDSTLPTRCYFASLGGRSISNEITANEQIYWVAPVEIKGIVHYKLYSKYSRANHGTAAPAQNTTEHLALECVYEPEMKQRFAWNTNTNSPAYMSLNHVQYLLCVS